MKKVFSFLFVMGVMLLSFNSKAQDCSQVADILCNALSKVTDQVNQCTTLDGLNKINFDSCIDEKAFNAVPESCAEATIADADKARIKTSFNTFFDTLANKTYQLCGGMLQRSDIDAQFNPAKAFYSQSIDQSKTYNDLISKLASQE